MNYTCVIYVFLHAVLAIVAGWGASVTKDMSEHKLLRIGYMVVCGLSAILAVVWLVFPLIFQGG